MNFFNIIDSIQKFDGDAIGRLEHSSRRMFMNRIGSKLAATAAPLAFGAIVNKAYAQTPTAIEVLQYAQTLEYLEETFYFRGNRTTNLIPAAYTLVFNQIERHETQHVTFLKAALGSNDPGRPEFDWTAGGAFPTVISNFEVYATVAKAFEDTGVRAYKGQAGNLSGALLEYALQVHSVEARHASLIRRILAQIASDAPTKMTKGWISGEMGFPGAVYQGAIKESNVTHLGINASTLPGIGSISVENVTEAFDEPLTMAEVLAIAGPFIKKK